MNSVKLQTYEYLDQSYSKLGLLQREMWKSLGQSLFASKLSDIKLSASKSKTAASLFVVFTLNIYGEIHRQ